MTRDPRRSAQHGAPRRPRDILATAGLVVVLAATSALVVGAIVNGANQPVLPIDAAQVSSGASASLDPGVSGGAVASASIDPSSTPAADEVAWVPVVGFWSTATTIAPAALAATLQGTDDAYDVVIVPAGDREAIAAALDIEIADSVKSGTPGQVGEAVRKGAFGLVRASDVTPDVRALGIGKAQLFGAARLKTLAAWPLRGAVDAPGAWDQGRTWTLVAGGDILLDRGVAVQVTDKGKGVDFPYDGGTAEIVKEVCCSQFNQKTPVTKRTGEAGAVRALLTSADLALANLESPVDDKWRFHLRGTVFSGDPRLLDGVKNAGIDFVSLANNHIRDSGADGVLDTVKALDARGIAHSGAGDGFAEARRPAIFETHGVTVAIFGCDAIAASYWTSGDAIGSRRCDTKTLVPDIKAARKTADVVIVYPHWGVEYRATPASSQRKLAAAWAKAGAALVIGNHAHWAAGMEAIDGTLVWYALGNFVFDQTWSTRTMEGLLVEMTFEGPTLRQVRLRPHVILDQAQPNFLDPAGDGAAVLKQVRAASKGLLPY